MEWELVANSISHPFGRWLTCPDCDANTTAFRNASTDAGGSIHCVACGEAQAVTGIQTVAEWVQCPMCGYDSTVRLSLNNAGDIVVTCSECPKRDQIQTGGC